MNSDIKHLREVSLSQELALQLAPVIDAYRPHTEPNIDKEDKIKEESEVGMNGIINTYEAIKREQDLQLIERRKEYNMKWKGYRSYYTLGLNNC